MKTPRAVPTKELTRIKKVLETAAPTDLELNIYNRLKDFLKREPTEQEIGNMKSDANLINWAANDL